LFNPKEYSFTKSNSWEKQKNAGGNLPQVTFSGGEPASLTLELLFDTYLAGGENAADVREKYTKEIWNLMKVDPRLTQKKPKKARPPFVRFQWGEAWSFVGVITNITEKFTLFTSKGTPVRATLNLTIQQLRDEGTMPSQNPTSGGVGGERVWTVVEGDTLAWIASREYGDSTQWRRIAEANRLRDVRELQPGRQLVIPNA
ncbi:MAG: LysM peptidoglycan-binding domain-containing protein, partial [Acidobacteria bacterium]|nr:LysM peptidoglycan-binding domain-containing protein [Acidobacteriota bacterium]